MNRDYWSTFWAAILTLSLCSIFLYAVHLYAKKYAKPAGEPIEQPVGIDPHIQKNYQPKQ